MGLSDFASSIITFADNRIKERNKEQKEQKVRINEFLEEIDRAKEIDDLNDFNESLRKINSMARTIQLMGSKDSSKYEDVNKITDELKDFYIKKRQEKDDEEKLLNCKKCELKNIYVDIADEISAVELKKLESPTDSLTYVMLCDQGDDDDDEEDPGTVELNLTEFTPYDCPYETKFCFMEDGEREFADANECRKVIQNYEKKIKSFLNYKYEINKLQKAIEENFSGRS